MHGSYRSVMDRKPDCCFPTAILLRTFRASKCTPRVTRASATLVHLLWPTARDPSRQAGEGAVPAADSSAALAAAPLSGSGYITAPLASSVTSCLSRLLKGNRYNRHYALLPQACPSCQMAVNLFSRLPRSRPSLHLTRARDCLSAADERRAADPNEMTCVHAALTGKCRGLPDRAASLERPAPRLPICLREARCRHIRR